MKLSKTEKKEIECFLEYILDKVEECYYNECRKAVDRFLKEIEV